VGSVSLRRETIFNGPPRDLPVGSKSSKDVWIFSNSSRAASSRSISLLIVWRDLLGRGMTATYYAFQSRKSVR
jgi:hypothetical protein